MLFKFIYVYLIYLFKGIDKICAVTQTGKIYFISTRVYPLVNQSILDEISGSLNINELCLTKKFLVDAQLDLNVSNFLQVNLFFLFKVYFKKRFIITVLFKKNRT